MITAFKDMTKIIDQTRQNEGQITQLDFSSVKIFRFTQKIKQLVQKCQNLTVLKLCECQLNSLDKLPNLDITGIDISINKLKDNDIQQLLKYKNLSMLNLSDNFITSIDSIKLLKSLTKLKDLQLAGNQIQKLPNYRQDIFNDSKRLKNLQLLDKLDQFGLPPPYDSHSDDVISQLDNQQDQDQQNCDDDEQQCIQDDSQQNNQFENKRKYHKYQRQQQDN